jgi:hypothetical protein
MVVWCILTVAYPELAKLVKLSPRCLVEISLIVNHLKNFDNLLVRKEDFQKKFIISWAAESWRI